MRTALRTGRVVAGDYRLRDAPPWPDIWLSQCVPPAHRCRKAIRTRRRTAEGTFPGSTRIGSCAGKSGRAAGFSKSYIASLRRYWEAQVRVYAGSADGWMMCASARGLAVRRSRRD
jgi:hypothetical protein